MGVYGLSSFAQRVGERALYGAGIDDVAGYGRPIYETGSSATRLSRLLGALRGVGAASAVAGAGAVGYQVGGWLYCNYQCSK